MGIIASVVNFGPDHARLFLNGWKNYSIGCIAQHLKGYSSYMMRKNHRHLFASELWGGKFWSGGCFYRTVGAVTSESVAYYIENSQKEHWNVLDYDACRERKSQLSLRHFVSSGRFGLKPEVVHTI